MITSVHKVRSLRITVITLASILAACASLVCAQTADKPQPGPELKKLEFLVGEWNYEGEGPDSPFGPGGKFRGKEIRRMVLNGSFLESRWEDNAAAGLVLRGYDPVKKAYIDYGFESDGSVTPSTFTVSGNTWTGTESTRTDKDGKAHELRFLESYSPDGSKWTQKSEYSDDGGKTWKTVFELTGTRSDASAKEAKEQSVGDKSEEVAKLERAYDKALIEQDAAAFERLLADEYTLTQPAGKVLTKAEVLANAKAGTVKFDADKSKSDSVKVRVFGDTALVTGRWTEKGTEAGKDFEGISQFTVVFLKRDGAWKIVSDQATLIKKE